MCAVYVDLRHALRILDQDGPPLLSTKYFGRLAEAELFGAFRQKTGFMGIRVHADYPLHCGRADAPWRSLSVIIGDAARAFRRLAPMAFAEASAHALVAHDAID